MSELQGNNQEALRAACREAEALYYLGDWFAVGSIFSRPFRTDSEVINCARVLMVVEAASVQLLNQTLLSKTATTTRAEEIIEILGSTFSKLDARPKKGIIIGESVWYSSADLAADGSPQMVGRDEHLKSFDIQFAAMTNEDQRKIVDWCARLNLRVYFSEEDVPDEDLKPLP